MNRRMIVAELRVIGQLRIVQGVHEASREPGPKLVRAALAGVDPDHAGVSAE